MRVQRISNSQPIKQITFTGTPIKIMSDDNKHVKFLYNRVSDILKEEKLGAVFNNGSNGHIDISSPKPTTLQKLKDLGIKFIEDIKKK